MYFYVIYTLQENVFLLSAKSGWKGKKVDTKQLLV